MTTKTTPAGRDYVVEGRSFQWVTDDDATITIPLRLKLKLIRSVGLGQDLDAEAMFRLLEALAPDEVDTIVEMDLNDFTAMFAAWQVEYQALAGASLGESSRSSS